MAFTKKRLSLMAVAGVKDANDDPKGNQFFFYHAHGDDVTASEYFKDVDEINENDLVYVPDDDAGTPILGYVDGDGTLKNLDVTPAS